MRSAVLFCVFILAAILGSCSTQSIKNESASIGGKAFNFNLPDQDGKMTTLEGILKNNRGAVIAFYPKDESKN